MALNFPQNPAIGRVYTAPNGTSYTYDGVRWRVGAAVRSTIKDISYTVDAGKARSSWAFISGSGNATRIDARTSTVAYSYISMTETPTGTMELIWDGSWDDDWRDVGLPFTVTFLGTTYANSQFLVSSNSYIAFGDEPLIPFSPYYTDPDDITIEASFFIPSEAFVFDPAGPDGGDGTPINLPALYVASYDNAVQQIYTLTTGSSGSRTFIMRWSGNADYSNSTEHPIIWEVRFYENQPGIIDLLIIADARGTNAANGISDSTQWLAGRSPRTPFPTGFGSYQIIQDLNLTELLWDGGTAALGGTEYDLNLDGGSANSRYPITNLDGGGA